LVCTKGDTVVLNRTSTKSAKLKVAVDSLYGEKTHEHESCEEFIFTTSGSYLVKYDDGTLGVAQWKWKNEKKDTLYYAWEGEWDEDGVVSVSFNKNNQLVLVEVHNATFNEHHTYYFTEKK
jgi:hypothetical protein